MTSIENWKYVSMALQTVCIRHMRVETREWEKETLRESLGLFHGPH